MDFFAVPVLTDKYYNVKSLTDNYNAYEMSVRDLTLSSYIPLYPLTDISYADISS